MPTPTNPITDISDAPFEFFSSVEEVEETLERSAKGSREASLKERTLPGTLPPLSTSGDGQSSLVEMVAAAPDIDFKTRLNDDVPNDSVTHAQDSTASSVSSAFPTLRQQCYKSKMCRQFTQDGHCRYSTHCQFAHTQEELRSPNTSVTGTCSKNGSNGSVGIMDASYGLSSINSSNNSNSRNSQSNSLMSTAGLPSLSQQASLRNELMAATRAQAPASVKGRKLYAPAPQTFDSSVPRPQQWTSTPPPAQPQPQFQVPTQQAMFDAYEAHLSVAPQPQPRHQPYINSQQQLYPSTGYQQSQNAPLQSQSNYTPLTAHAQPQSARAPPRPPHVHQPYQAYQAEEDAFASGANRYPGGGAGAGPQPPKPSSQQLGIRKPPSPPTRAPPSATTGTGASARPARTIQHQPYAYPYVPETVSEPSSGNQAQLSSFTPSPPSTANGHSARPQNGMYGAY